MVRFSIAAAVLAALIGGALAAPDEALYRKNGYGLPATRGQAYLPENLVASHSRAAEIWSSKTVKSSGQASPLRPIEKAVDIRYDVGAAKGKTIDDFLNDQPVTGLLILKDDQILVERYQYERHAAHRFQGHSMTKTVVAMLVGIAMAEGKLGSVDDLAEAHAPDLRGSEYGRTPLKALLRMSSGVKFREDYDGSDDVAKLGRAVMVEGIAGAAAVTQFNERIHPPGARFSYASAETQVLTLALRHKVGDVSRYLSEKIWQPIGAESDAAWLTGASGEAGYCCLNATLRDWGRIGRLLAHDGNWNGHQVVPRQWVIDATSVHADAPHLAPGNQVGSLGYGYQTWLLAGDRNFALLGVRGQAVFVDPKDKIVMAMTAVYTAPRPGPTGAERFALWRGVKASVRAAAIP
jgi:CubicO group peptidase (beta-lactamase class C family)